VEQIFEFGLGGICREHTVNCCIGFDFDRRIAKLGLQPQLGLWAVRWTWRDFTHHFGSGSYGSDLGFDMS
jgi:hypothetical protein